MPRIEYKYGPRIEYKYGPTKDITEVWLDRKLVGDIYHDDGGWRYYLRGSASGGELFPTIQLCKKSLEAA